VQRAARVADGVSPVQEKVFGHRAVELGVAIDLKEFVQHPQAKSGSGGERRTGGYRSGAAQNLRPATPSIDSKSQLPYDSYCIA